MTLSDQELIQLMAVLDLATKSGGLSVAQVTLLLAVKVKEEQERRKAAQ